MTTKIVKIRDLGEHVSWVWTYSDASLWQTVFEDAESGDRYILEEERDYWDKLDDVLSAILRFEGMDDLDAGDSEMAAYAIGGNVLDENFFKDFEVEFPTVEWYEGRLYKKEADEE